MKKRIISMFMSVVMAVCLVGTAFASQTSPFTDVSTTHWAYNNIVTAKNDGIMTGTGGNKFSPSATLTKAEFSTILVRAFYADDLAAAQADTSWAEGAFFDPNTWYAVYEKVARDHYLFVYTQKGAMDMTANISRYDMAGMMYGVMLDKKVTMPSDTQLTATQTKIADWSSVPASFQTPVATCYFLGLLTGTDAKGTFNGTASTDRASTAVVYGRMKTSIGANDNNVTTKPDETTTPEETKPEENNSDNTVDMSKAGTAGYLTNGKPATEENVLALLAELKETKYPDGWKYDAYDGYYFKARGTNGLECAKAAFMISDDIFGVNAPLRSHTDYANIRPGDLIQFPGHWAIAICNSWKETIEGKEYYLIRTVDGGPAGILGWNNGSGDTVVDNQTIIYTRYGD